MSQPEPIPAVDAPVVMFVIAREWSPRSTDQAIYEATRGDWKVGADTRERAQFAFGIVGGVVRGAYRIASWHQNVEGRWRFAGDAAPDLGVVGTSVTRLAPPKGAANPVRRFMDGVPPNPTDSVQQIADELNAEPLARIMYGQRELFHSNLLAWFFDALPSVADHAFRDLTVDAIDAVPWQIRSVEREAFNFDLVLRWPGAAPLVIENKVFSLPEPSQLDAYREKTDRCKGARARHVLLSVTEPREPIDGWRYVSYDELADRIDLALADANVASYEVETMRRYARVARLLSSLLRTAEVHDIAESVWYDATQLAGITSPQTRTALRKLRARHVQDALDEHGPGHGWTESAISHSQPLVGWRRSVVIDGVELEAGWQYQEGQFRRCVVLPHLHGRTEEQGRSREAFAAAHPELFEFQPLGDVLTPSSGDVMPRGRFGHFKPDFVYRYVKAPDQTVRQLIEASHTMNDQLEALAR